MQWRTAAFISPNILLGTLRATQMLSAVAVLSPVPQRGFIQHHTGMQGGPALHNLCMPAWQCQHSLCKRGGSSTQQQSFMAFLKGRGWHRKTQLRDSYLGESSNPIREQGSGTAKTPVKHRTPGTGIWNSKQVYSVMGESGKVICESLCKREDYFS